MQGSVMIGSPVSRIMIYDAGQTRYALCQGKPAKHEPFHQAAEGLR